MPDDRSPSTGRQVAGIGLAVLVGTVLAAYVWDALNELLAGHVDRDRLIWLVPALVLSYLLLRAMSGMLGRWEGGEGRTPDSSSPAAGGRSAP